MQAKLAKGSGIETFSKKKIDFVLNRGKLWSALKTSFETDILAENLNIWYRKFSNFGSTSFLCWTGSGITILFFLYDLGNITEFFRKPMGGSWFVG